MAAVEVAMPFMNPSTIVLSSHAAGFAIKLKIIFLVMNKYNSSI
jgi:hypothetical protein